MGLKGAMSEPLSVPAASVANVNGARVAREEASDMRSRPLTSWCKPVQAGASRCKPLQAAASRLHRRCAFHCCALSRWLREAAAFGAKIAVRIVFIAHGVETRAL
jgi:hypothetical protein